MDQIVLSQTLARNLSHVCTKKLSTLYSAAEQMQSEQPNPATQTATSGKTTAIGGGVPTSNSSSTNTNERYFNVITTGFLLNLYFMQCQ